MTTDAQRLARALVKLDEQRLTCRQLRARADTFRRGGMVVVDGEVAALEQLEVQLTAADSALRSLAFAELPQTDEVTAIEQIVARIDFSALTRALDEKHEEEIASRTQCEELLRVQHERLQPLRDAMAAARGVLAATRNDEDTVRELDRIEQQARGALERNQVEEFYRKVDELGARDVDAKVRELYDAVKAARRHGDHAELLVIHTPAKDRKWHHYSVILRTPGEKGRLGSSIRGVSTLNDAQRRMLFEDAARLEQNIRRRAAGAAAEQAALRANRDVRLAADLDAAGGPPVALEESARKLGEWMFREILPDPLQKEILDADCSVTITTNDLELPWELMFRRDTFVCLDRPVARMPMGTASSAPRKRPSLKNKLRVLLLGVNHRGDLPAVATEIEQIDAALKAKFAGKLDIVVPDGRAIRTRYLTEALHGGEFDVIHYAGHADFDRKEAGNSALDLIDGAFTAENIKRLLEGNPFVFLNACETGSHANAADPEPGDAGLSPSAEGLASAFIYGGAAGCIGNLWPIHDDAAAEFAIAFYGHVLEDRPFGKAMMLARTHVREKFKERLSWASFVLFGNPLARLNWTP